MSKTRPSGKTGKNVKPPGSSPEKDSRNALLERIRVLKLNDGSPREVVEELDEIAREDQEVRNRCLNALAKICRENVILPTSYIVTGLIRGEERGRGEFTTIYIGTYKRRDVRCKVFWKAGNDREAQGAFYSSIVRWKYLSHPNLLPFLGVSETGPLTLVSPWMPNNIIGYTANGVAATRLQLLRDTACGLEYLHSLNMAHGRINPGNILITENGVARITDFGIAQIIAEPGVAIGNGSTTSRQEDARYKSPEQVDHRFFKLKKSEVRKESDVYSFGMTAYEVLVGFKPYQGITAEQPLGKAILDGIRPPHPGTQQAAAKGLSDDTWKILKACWRPELQRRPTISEVYEAFKKSADGPVRVMGGYPPAKHESPGEPVIKPDQVRVREAPAQATSTTAKKAESTNFLCSCLIQ